MNDIDKLRTALNRAGVNDRDILGGIKLSDTGLDKIGAHFGMDRPQVERLFAQLVATLRDETLTEDIQETDRRRFSYEPDTNGNVTVRDNQEGKSVFVRGWDAAALLARLKTLGDADDQAVLAHFMPLMEEDETAHWKAKKETGFYGRAGAGCIFLALDTNRILLGRRSALVEQPYTWGGWGGAIDGDEDPKEAIRREVKEETGYAGTYEVKPLYVFESGTFRYHNFLVVVAEEFQPKLNWEHAGYEWCDWGHWPSPLHFGLVALFNDPESVKTIHETMNHEIMEAAEEPEDFSDEIAAKSGTYNFPYEIGEKRGLATARFTAGPKEPKIDVVSVRDHEGKNLTLTPSEMKILKDQALAFVDEA